MGVDRAVAMIEGAGLVIDKLMSHKAKSSWCFLGKLVTEVLETSLSFVLAGKLVAVNQAGFLGADLRTKVFLLASFIHANDDKYQRSQLTRRM